MTIRIYLDGVNLEVSRVPREALGRAWYVYLPDRIEPAIFERPQINNLRSAVMWAVENGQRFSEVYVGTMRQPRSLPTPTQLVIRGETRLATSGRKAAVKLFA